MQALGVCSTALGIDWRISRSSRRRFNPCSSCNGAASIQAVDRESAVSDLLQWLQNKGALTQEQASGVRVKRGPRGLGLFSTRPISRGEEVISIPSSVWMDSNAVKQSELGNLCQGLKPWVAVALLLIHERGKASSEWHSYIRVLPHSLDSPLFWSEEELRELKGTQFLSSVSGFKTFIKREYEKVMDGVVKPRSDLFDVSLFTLEAFTWAFGILRSRTFSPLVGENLALVPLADFVNHSSAVASEDFSWKTKAAAMFSRQQALSLRCAAKCKQNEEIVMEYDKKKGNAQLALDYGFVDESISRDSFALTLEISPSERFADDKADIAELNGLSSTAYFSLYQNQAPETNMLAFLRLIALAGTDSFLLEALFRNAVWDHLKLPVSQDNEEAICEAMIEGCQATLKQFGSTIEEDEELLDSGKLSTRRRIAVVVRLGEKRILQEQLQWFERRAAGLDDLEYYAERRLRNLGLLDDKGNLTSWASRS